MSAYKLPDWLGGRECQVIRAAQGPYVTVSVVEDDVSAHIELMRGLLVEVAPPLPPEPPTGGAAASEYTVWLRSASGWFDGFSSEPTEFITWDELNRRHPELRVLVHDPVGRVHVDAKTKAHQILECATVLNEQNPEPGLTRLIYIFSAPAPEADDASR